MDSLSEDGGRPGIPTPAPPALNRCDDLDPPVRHVAIAMNSHMTHTLT
jgi:hypothetical protein